MRVPSNHIQYQQHHQPSKHFATTTTTTTNGVISNQNNNCRHRSRSQFLDMSAGTTTGGYNNNNNEKNSAVIVPPVRPSSASPPPPASGGSGNGSLSPPELPNFLHDPVLNRTYARGRYLGKGGFAWCYEVTDIRNRTAFALKVVPKTRVIKQRHRNKVLREISIHNPLRHKNVVRLYSAFEDDDNIYMVLELCQLDSLVSVMKKRKTLTECETRYYMLQLLTGVQYLHDDARILHRDLKLGNMLLTDQMQVKIGDFGLAAEMGRDGCDRYGQVCGTPNYISPEVLRKEGHSSASEAWALGCIMYALLVGKPPFETHSLDATYTLILNCQYSYPSHIRLNSSARDLIHLFLNPLPSHRPTPVQALGHEFFNTSIPMTLPIECCHSAPNTAQISFCAAGAHMKTIRTTAVMASTHRMNTEMVPSSQQMVVVHTATTATATYRSSTPFEIFDENNRCVGTMVKNDHGKVTLTNLQHQQQQRVQGSSAPQQPPPPPPPTSVATNVPQYYQMTTNMETAGISPYSSSVATTSTTTSVPSTCSSVGSSLNSICPLDSFGNVTFGANRENALTQWLYDINHLLNDALLNAQNYPPGFSQTNMTTINNTNITYVIKWIDYSNRYGFGCQYNNGGVSIMQNDRARLCLSADRRYCRRWNIDSNLNGCVNGSDVFDLWTPTMAQDSLDVIRHFVDYMDANLMTGGFSDAVTPLSMAVPFIVLWRRFSEYLLIVLSDGTFQINFLNHHTKVVLSRMAIHQSNQQKFEVALTFIDESRLARTCPLSQAAGTVIDVTLLHRVRQLLGNYVLTPTDCFTAEI